MPARTRLAAVLVAIAVLFSGHGVRPLTVRVARTATHLQG